jgi:hypothetical protein
VFSPLRVNPRSVAAREAPLRALIIFQPFPHDIDLLLAWRGMYTYTLHDQVTERYASVRTFTIGRRTTSVAAGWTGRDTDRAVASSRQYSVQCTVVHCSRRGAATASYRASDISPRALSLISNDRPPIILRRRVPTHGPSARLHVSVAPCLVCNFFFFLSFSAATRTLSRALPPCSSFFSAPPPPPHTHTHVLLVS